MPNVVLQSNALILRALVKGHPERRMTASRAGIGVPVNALTWDEAQVTSGLSFNEFGDGFAKLVRMGFVDSGVIMRSSSIAGLGVLNVRLHDRPMLLQT